MTEFQHQYTLMKWALSVRATYPELRLLFAIPNGGTRDPIEAKNLKRTGLKPGVPDLCLPVPRGKYHGLYIEMKTEEGTTSPEQDWWLEELKRQGYCAGVCHGWDAAKRTIEWYLSLKGEKT